MAYLERKVVPLQTETSVVGYGIIHLCMYMCATVCRRALTLSTTMEKQQQIQIQFKLNDVRQVQFVTLCNEWPKGEMQVGNQINFSSDTQQRLVRCLLNIEYKQNDITQMMLAVETVFEFSRESWSSMYDLNGDQWILPVGLVHHLTDVTIGAARGILAARTGDAGFPRAILPLVNPQQFMRDPLRFPRIVPARPDAEQPDTQA